MSLDPVASQVQPTVTQIDPVAARAAQTGRQPAVSSAEVSKAQAESVARPEPTDEELNNAVNSTNDFLKMLSQNLQFSVDKETRKTVVKLVDMSTKEVVRQFPSEEMLSIARAIDKLQGLLIRDKA